MRLPQYRRILRENFKLRKTFKEGTKEVVGRIITPFSETCRDNSPYFVDIVIDERMTVVSYCVDRNQMFQNGDRRLEIANVMVKVKQSLYGPG
jgi:hypothetical protein